MWKQWINLILAVLLILAASTLTVTQVTIVAIIIGILALWSALERTGSSMTNSQHMHGHA